VQAMSTSGPWYWRVQEERPGNPPDWRDVNGAFTSQCPTFLNGGLYLEQCLGYPYGDWMLILR
jgi:hypothetical protein